MRGNDGWLARTFCIAIAAIGCVRFGKDGGVEVRSVVSNLPDALDGAAASMFEELRCASIVVTCSRTTTGIAAVSDESDAERFTLWSACISSYIVW